MATPHKVIRLMLVVLTVILLAVIGVRIAMKLKNPITQYPSPQLASYGRVDSFTFTNQEGQPFGSAQLSGSPWVADFVFTRCMGPCPVVTTKMAQLQKQFSAYPQLKFVSFSVDPNFDQPAVLKKYAQTYGADLARWTFLTGKKSDLYELTKKSFHLAVEPTQQETDIVHSLYFVLVDSQGTIRGYYNSTDLDALERLKVDLQFLLTSPPDKS